MGEPIGVLHASSPDVLGNDEQYKDPRWHIDEGITVTLQPPALYNHLQFNICDLETSYYKMRILTGLIASLPHCPEHHGRSHVRLSILGRSPRTWRYSRIGRWRFSCGNGIFLWERFLFWVEAFSLPSHATEYPLAYFG